MNAQEQFWSGEFGNDYTGRNRVDWRARIPFWARIINETGARSVYEVGCNAGWNLSAIRRAYPDVTVRGHDLNADAIKQATLAGLPVADRWIDAGGQFDLVFTAGVLIHIAPENLQAMMRQIVDASAHYVLAVEYFAEHEDAVEYRGHTDRLWKRDYGALYEAMGLRRVEWAHILTGEFDRCTYWLMEKP